MEKRRKSHRRKLFIQKNFFLLASVLLIFSSFFSLSAVIYAEGNQKQYIDVSSGEIEVNEEEKEVENGEGTVPSPLADLDHEEGVEEKSSKMIIDEAANEEEQGEEGFQIANRSSDEEVEQKGQIFSEQSFAVEGFQILDDPEFEDGDYKYIIGTDGNITITRYVGDDKDITIPSMIDGKAVTVVGEKAFMFKTLTNVTIPNSINIIGNHAFYGVGLESVNIESGVKTIGMAAFGENNLINVVLPDSVEMIGDYAFFNNELESVTISSSVKKIGDSSFAQNLLNKIIIPDNVEIIGEGAFAINKLKSITIPEGVKTIGAYAFGNNNLINVIIPKSVETIGDFAFILNDLENVTIYNSEVNFGEDVFMDQFDKENFTIKGYISSTAFEYATANRFKFVPINKIEVDGIPLPLEPNMVVDISLGSELLAKLMIPDSIFDENIEFVTLEIKSAKQAKATGLKAVGAVLDFIFRDENGDVLKVTGDFVLSLRVKDGVTDAAIYHEIGEDDWEKIGGEIENDYISAIVTNFSVYGVFQAQADIPEDPQNPKSPGTPSKPTAPEKPSDSSESVVEVDIERGESKTEVTVTGEVESDSSKSRTLPNTATIMFNISVVGSIILIIGLAMFIFTRRQKTA